MSTVLQMLLRRKSAYGAGGKHKIVACNAEEHQGAHGLAAGHKAAEHQQKGCFNGAHACYIGQGIGKEEHQVVKKGESFYYPASCNHYLENPGKTPAIILWVSSPPYF